MQVDPMSPIKGAVKMNSQRIVTLEGKSRLPARIHELVVDFGGLMHQAQHSAASGEAIQVGPIAKNFAALETTVTNTHNTLKKLEKICDRSDESVPQLTDSLAQLANVDRFNDAIRALSIE
ncbi:hypothetical protein M3Y99_00310300 [Aphelenchoides fujianensis]|nr:hypothetical protein M3Y99_00310300 [Aphelenchoides fujianensis]